MDQNRHPYYRAFQPHWNLRAGMTVLSKSPNHCLSSLSAEDAELLNPHLTMVDQPAGAILYRADDVITHIYFPYSGIVSIIVGVTTGEFVEAGVIGHNSAVGISALLGSTAIHEAIVQVAIKAAKIDAGILQGLVEKSGSLRASCMSIAEMKLGQVQQVAACNALHSLDQRLARWLLQANDILNDDIVPLTQESLSQMLGVNRSSVTLAARRLQEAGLIDYHRGHIRIVGIDNLKDVSCECYGAINALYLRLIGWSPNSH